MTSILRNGVAVLALVSSAGIAAAASTVGSATAEHLNLTASQRHEIWQGVSKQATKETPPAGFKATVGAALPSSIKMQPLPTSVSKQVPAVKSDEYAMLQKQVLIVDPSSKKIVDIVTQ
jgi:hypothetical protein